MKDAIDELIKELPEYLITVSQADLAREAILQYTAKIVAAEREACARAAETCFNEPYGMVNCRQHALGIARIIRARSDGTTQPADVLK